MQRARKRWQAHQQSTLMKKNEGLPLRSGPATDHTHTKKVSHTLSLKYVLLNF